MAPVPPAGSRRNALTRLPASQPDHLNAFAAWRVVVAQDLQVKPCLNVPGCTDKRCQLPGHIAGRRRIPGGHQIAQRRALQRAAIRPRIAPSQTF